MTRPFFAIREADGTFTDHDLWKDISPEDEFGEAGMRSFFAALNAPSEPETTPADTDVTESSEATPATDEDRPADVAFAEWDESQHPRADDGKFTSGGGSSGGTGTGGGADSTAGRVEPGPSSAVQERPAAARKGAQPVVAVRRAAQSYNDKYGLEPIKEGFYASINEDVAKRIADAYDELPDDDHSPETEAAYKALASEVQRQFDFAEKEMGMSFEAWTKEGQPYANSSEMRDDVEKNKHLFFFTGGTANKFMSVRDGHGLSANDKFRAVHDLFGHSAEDFQFGPRGEENAWLKHSMMFSPQAQRALTAETRGQNSWVNYGRHNYNKDGKPLNIPATQKPYAPQKSALLPPWVSDWKVRKFGDWDESLHPRDDVGKFAPAGGSSTPARAPGSDSDVPPAIAGLAALGKDVVLYHGTTDAALDAIKRDGIKAGAGKGADQSQPLSVATFGGRDASVYMIGDPEHAEIFAEMVARARNAKPIVLEVKIPTAEAARLKTDELAEDADRLLAVRLESVIKPEWIARIGVARTPLDPYNVRPKVKGGFEWRRLSDADGRTVYVVFFVAGDAVAMGGPGSGNFGHAGRPGEVGGSAPGEGGGMPDVHRTGASEAHFETPGERGLGALLSTLKTPDAGFTYHAVTGHQPKTGYAVSVYKGREATYDVKTLKVTDLLDYAHANWGLLSKSDNYFGGWHNPDDGKLYLDVSKVVATQDRAERLGRMHNQLAYYDFKNNTSVKVPPRRYTGEAA